MSKKSLTSRERVKTTLEHEEPDCIPYDLGGASITGIHSVAYRNLLSYMGKDHLLKKEREGWYYEKLQGLAPIDEEVKNDLKVDTRGARCRNPSDWELEIEEVEGNEAFTDEWGCLWIRSQDGYYFDEKPGKSYPLTGSISIEDIRNYPWPNASDPERIKNLRRELEELRGSECAILLEAPFNGVFSLGFRMRGYVDFYKDLVANPELACSLMDKFADLKVQFWDMALPKLGDVVDVIIELDDLGGQDGTLISPDMYRKLVKPRQKRVFSFIKNNIPDSTYLFLHSDGSIYDIIPDLIEIGVDILNPVQVGAAKMNSSKLKKEFGDSLTFWGGGIDTQNVLSNATPDEVKEEVKKRIDDFAPGGGYVFAAIHNVQADVPPDNFMAMWETLQEYKMY